MLGADVAIDIDLIDEANRRVDIPELLSLFASDGYFGMVGLVGVPPRPRYRAAVASRRRPGGQNATSNLTKLPIVSRRRTPQRKYGQ